MEKACQGRSFVQRRDAAIVAVLTATGIRAGELAGIRYDPRGLRRSDLDLMQREITVHGKGGRQRIVRRGRQAGVDVWPHRFRHHFSHTWLDRGGPEGDLMELNGRASPQMLRRYGASARSARARRSYDRIMDNAPLPEPAEERRSRHPAQAKYPPFGVLPLASAGDEDDVIARAFSGSGKPVLSRVDPYGDLVLSPAEMGRFIAEAGSLAGGVDETGAGRVRRVLELARRCGTPREQNSTCREIRRRPRYSEPCGGHGCHGLATKARAEAGGTAVGCRPRKAVPGAARLTGNLERRPQRLD